MTHTIYAHPYTRFDGGKGQITVATGPIIISQDRMKVLLHVSSETRKWQFIGGRLDDEESLRSNALARAREVVGETPVSLFDAAPLIILDQIDRAGVKEDILLMHFQASISDESQI